MSAPPQTDRQLAWQGWQMPLEQEWNPVRLEGDWRKGYILLADLTASRLAIRWDTPPRRFAVDKWCESALLREVGRLAAAEAAELEPGPDWTTGRLYTEPEPPGRDVWVGHSRVSGRVVQLVMPTKSRSRLLRETLVARLRDQPTDGPQQWQVFDLTATSPARWSLRSHRLNAGDLMLSFGHRTRVATLRQVGPATIALARQSIEQWLVQHQLVWRKLYRAAGDVVDGSRMIRRRRRFALARWIAVARHGVVRHDLARDRLLLSDADDPALARELIDSLSRHRPQSGTA